MYESSVFYQEQPYLPHLLLLLLQLLAMIGGVIESGHSVNGAVVSRRKKGDRVALWTSKKSAKINLNIW